MLFVTLDLYVKNDKAVDSTSKLFGFKPHRLLLVLLAFKLTSKTVVLNVYGFQIDIGRQMTYESITEILKANDIIVDAAEVQGILCGMLAGGMDLDNQQWLEALADLINQSQALNDNAQSIVVALFDQVCQQFVESDFSLTLCIPDDDESINIRGSALVNWVQGFLLGFGLYQNDLTKCSDDAKEALEDFSQIAKMDENMDDDEESEQAFVEVLEYVRVSAMLCFNELGKSIIDSRQQSPVIH